MRRIALCFLLGACAFQMETVDADPYGIVIKAGRYVNPSLKAQEHCAQYDKSARLFEVGELGPSGLYRFVCS